MWFAKVFFSIMENFYKTDLFLPDLLIKPASIAQPHHFFSTLFSVKGSYMVDVVAMETTFGGKNIFLTQFYWIRKRARARELELES